jgi:hypothetical protein
MRRSMLVVCGLLACTTLGCDRIKQAIEKRKNRNRTPTTQTAGRDTTKQAAPAGSTATGQPPATNPGSTVAARPQTGAAATPPAAPRPSPVTQRPTPVMLHDEPYNSADTGTIAPGMSVDQVIALWGNPSAIRHAGDYTYMHYRNGCELSCGTDDVVILQSGQVVDAILRWPGHGYSGQSSSPPGKHPEPTLP